MALPVCYLSVHALFKTLQRQRQKTLHVVTVLLSMTVTVVALALCCQTAGRVAGASGEQKQTSEEPQRRVQPQSQDGRAGEGAGGADVGNHSTASFRLH